MNMNRISIRVADALYLAQCTKSEINSMQDVRNGKTTTVEAVTKPRKKVG